jgi:hypothetical protein
MYACIIQKQALRSLEQRASLHRAAQTGSGCESVIAIIAGWLGGYKQALSSDRRRLCATAVVRPVTATEGRAELPVPQVPSVRKSIVGNCCYARSSSV